MTREELKTHCIKQIENCEKWAKFHGEEPHGKVYEEHKLILELLEQEPCEDAISRADAVKVASGYCHPQNIANELAKLPPVIPKPCKDAISRQAVIDGINEYFHDEYYQRTSIQNCRDCLIEDMIKDMPPVTPKPKTGQWIPVSEGLPKPNEYAGDVVKYYLVQNEYEDMLVARYTHSEYWEQIYQHKPCADEIVAWRPLPESYKPQESEVLNGRKDEKV